MVIVGGGPAGMALANILLEGGIDCLVLERRTRAHVLGRVRAGVLEPGSARFLEATGLSPRLATLGRKRDGTRIAWHDRPGLMIDVKRWTGQNMVGFGQTLLTEDLYARHDTFGAPYRDEVGDVEVRGLDSEAPEVSFRGKDGPETVLCDFVIGCDGSRSRCADLMPAGIRRTYGRTYPFGLLGVLVETPPVDDFTYIYHPDGFALAAQRGPNLSRYYVQTPADEGLEAWPDDRFWETFLHRAPPSLAAQVTPGPTIEKSMTAIRSKVVEPMQWGRLFLAGDAAHVVPPTGAKGLNLALSDVRLLSAALLEVYATGRRDSLDTYSERALRKVWAAANLSWRLTHLLHVFPGEDPFDVKLRQSNYDLLLESEALQEALAVEYSGQPFDS